MKGTLSKDDLLFHSVHGLCRVEKVTQTVSKEDTSYALLPVSSNRGKMRFVIPQSSLEESGFGKLITEKEAQAVLDYLRTGDKKETQTGATWALAEMVRTESCSKEFAKDARKRQKLDLAVRGLVGELSVVLKGTPKEAADQIRKNLKTISKVNPLVLAALADAGQDDI